MLPIRASINMYCFNYASSVDMHLYTVSSLSLDIKFPVGVDIFKIHHFKCIFLIIKYISETPCRLSLLMERRKARARGPERQS